MKELNYQHLISTDRAESKACLRALYHETFPKAKKYILKNSGSVHDAEDIFQEAIVILYQRVKTDKFKESDSLPAYCMGICKNLWLMKLRKEKTHQLSPQELDIRNEPEVELDSSLVKRVLAELSQECESLLIGFYYYKKSFAELQLQFGVGSIQAIKNKKGRCLKYLMTLLKDYGIGKDSFVK